MYDIWYVLLYIICCMLTSLWAGKILDYLGRSATARHIMPSSVGRKQAAGTLLLLLGSDTTARGLIFFFSWP